MITTGRTEPAGAPLPANPIRAAAEAIRTAGLHDSPMLLAKAALAAAGFTEAERQLRAVRTLVDIAGVEAARYGRGTNEGGCVSVANLRAALTGSYRAPESDYTEHLISMAGGDGDDDSGQALARAIHNRRRRKCIAAGEHQEQPPDASEPAKCPRCGL